MNTMVVTGLSVLAGIVLGSTLPIGESTQAPANLAQTQAPKVEQQLVGQSASDSYVRPGHGEQKSQIKTKISYLGTDEVLVSTTQSIEESARVVTGVELVSDVGVMVFDEVGAVETLAKLEGKRSLKLPKVNDGYYIFRASSLGIANDGQEANYIDEIYLKVEGGAYKELTSLEFSNESDINKAVQL